MPKMVGVGVILDGYGPKKRHGVRDLVRTWRAGVAEEQNAKPQRAGVDKRYDPRSYREQGIDLDATTHHGASARRWKRAGTERCTGVRNPPLLIISDMVRFRIRTNWTNSISLTHEFTLEGLADAGVRDKLKWAMSDPERLPPGESRQALTERAAATFVELAQSLRERGHEPLATWRTSSTGWCVCMVAEDVGLAPGQHVHPDARARAKKAR